MALRWTEKARGDLRRLHELLASVDAEAARRRVLVILAGVKRLAGVPRLGPRLREFDRREVRRIVVADYEVRYEVRGADLFILRIWHVREDR